MAILQRCRGFARRDFCPPLWIAAGWLCLTQVGCPWSSSGLDSAVTEKGFAADAEQDPEQDPDDAAQDAAQGLEPGSTAKARAKRDLVNRLLSWRADPQSLDDPARLRELLSSLIVQDEAVRGAAELALQARQAEVLPKLQDYLVGSSVPDYLLGITACRVIGPPSQMYAEPIVQRLRESFQLTNYLRYGGLANDDLRAPPLLESDQEGYRQYDERRQVDFQLRLGSLWALEEMELPDARYLLDLIEIVQSPFPPGAEFNLQCGAIRAISRMGFHGTPAITAILQAAQANNVSVRAQAMRALGRLGPHAPHRSDEIIEVLTEKLRTNYQRDKLFALEALAEFGPQAQAARAAVRDLMMDTSKSVMPRAAVTYYRITEESEDMLKLLKSTINDPTYESDTIDLIGELGEIARPLLPLVIARLDSSEAFTRETAVLCLKKLGPVAEPAIEKLKNLQSSDEDPLIRVHAEEALSRIAPPNTESPKK